MNQNVLLIAGAALLWWYFSKQQAVTPTPSSGSTATPTPTPTAASGVTPPAQTTQPGNVPTTPATTSGVTQSQTTRQAAFFKALLDAHAKGDPAITIQNTYPYATPYVLNWYLQNVSDAADTNALNIPLDQIFPGVDLTQPMNVVTYWLGMAPWLATKGISGINYNRAPAYAVVSGRFNGGWAV